MFENNTEADMVFSVSQDITTVIQSHGRVHEKGSPAPSEYIITRRGIVGKTCIILLQALNQLCKEVISCTLVSELTGEKVKGNIEKLGLNQYEISYQPIIKGRHQLHIKVSGQHIGGSPFPVAVQAPVEQLGTLIQNIGRVRGPEGVAVNQRGEVVVTERDRSRVSVFSPSGERLWSFGTHGSGQGQFDQPCGVVVDGKGCILVSDYNNHRIQKLTFKGEFLAVVGTEGNGPLQFKHPCGITYNPSNDKVYVVDEKNCRIQILTSDLKYVGTFGQKGSGKGEFDYPQYLACDSTGNVYVTDYTNHDIKVFTAKGKYKFVLWKHGQCGPNGITIDSHDRLYFSDWDNNCVHVLDAEGRAIMPPFGGFYCPVGLAVDLGGVVYVCDSKNNCVTVF